MEKENLIKLAEEAIQDERFEEAEAILAQLDEIENKPEVEEDDQEKENVEMKELQNQTKRDEVREFGAAIKTKNFRDFTSVEGTAIIPEEVLALVETPRDVLDLRELVNTVKTKTGAGSIPVLSKANDVMVSVAELAANPKLANPSLSQVKFDIETYRGYIPVSQELIDDADYDVAAMVANHLKDIAINTANKAILDELKTFTAKNAAGLDGIKNLLNVELKTGYRKQIVMTKSAFNEVDVMKDTTGRYLLTQDITSQSGYKLFGHEVFIVEDTDLGANGAKKMFIGDLKRAVVFVDRKQASVKWADHDIYGQLLAVFSRFDAVKADPDAGFLATLTVPTP